MDLAQHRLFGLLGFIIFDKGLPYYASLGSGWAKFSIGFFESVVSRASGFGIVYLSDLAPAVV